MAQVSIPLVPLGGNAGNPHAVHPESFQLHAQLMDHYNPPVVIVQPPVYQSPGPTPDPVPDYMCYSRLSPWCCICLGAAAAYYSRATRRANGAGRRAEAARNSQTALILNHIAVVVGSILLIILFIDIYQTEYEKSYP